ncbi:hypothetical protein GH714_018612 [Hevea brasiliensis]|uniref:Uncharacterized protein n=1 Tax=Hevea brasiliensis TaxID=3981 RepID=A0A6A6LD29_HEVBR|nr:hypothetical protein GH714_018612 [Hevea brasiliensis]
MIVRAGTTLERHNTRRCPWKILAASQDNSARVTMGSAQLLSPTRIHPLPLVAAAQQTGGQVMCILSTESDFIASRNSLGPYADCVKFVIGDAKALLLSDYKRADFVLIDCNIDDCEGVFRAARECGRNGRRLIIGFNAFQGSWPNEFKTHFLPIGEGLLVTRIGGKVDDGSGQRKRSRWVIRVDECTGEEHVYRVTCPQQEIEA